MEKGIFNQAYFRESEREKGKTRPTVPGVYKIKAYVPAPSSSPASPILSSPGSSLVPEDAQVFSPLHPAGTYGTELSSSIFSVYSVSAPQLK